MERHDQGFLRFLFALIIAALLALPAAAAHAAPPAQDPTPAAPSCDDLIDEGEAFYYRSANQDALARLNEALACTMQALDLIGQGRVLSDIGLIYGNTGEYDKALDNLQQSLEIRRRVGPPGAEAVTRNNLGGVYHSLGRYDEAMQQYQQALALFRQVEYKDGEAQALNNIGALDYSLGQYPDSLQHHTQALAIYRSLEDRVGERLSLNNLGTVYDRQEQDEKALETYQQALDIVLDPEDWPGKASLLNNIAAIYHGRGQYTEALERYEQALEINRRIGDPASESATLGNIGNMHQAQGEFETALEYYQQALEIANRIGAPDLQASALEKMASLSRNQAEYENAVDYFQQAIDTYRGIKDRRHEAMVINDMGRVYLLQGQLQQALKLFQQAHNLAVEIEDRALEGDAFNHIAEVYYSLGQHQDALQVLQKVLTIRREIGDQDGESVALNDLGAVNDELGQHEEALNYHQQALALRRKLNNRAGVATSLNNLGASYEGLQQYQEALDQYEQALAIRRELKDRVGEAAALDNIGVVYAHVGQYDRALAYHQQALDMRRAMGEREGEAISLENMGYAYYRQTRLDQALDAYEQSIQVFDTLRSSATVEEIRSGLASESAAAYEYAALLLVQQDRTPEGFEVAERARARTFLDQLGNRDLDVRAGADPELVAREQQLAAEIAELQSKLTEDGDVDYAGLKAQLESLQSAYGQVLVELKLTNPAYASLVSADTLSVGDIQATVLDDKTSLVSYFLTDEATLAFVLDQQDLFVAALPISRTRLAGQVERWRGLIRVEPAAGETQASDQIELAQDLYQTLIAPLLPHLRHRRLIIVPHQALHYLPFAALLDQNQQPLVDRFTLSTAPSASSLSPQLLNANENSGRLLAAGNPALPGSVAAPLPYGEAEARAVAALYPQATLLTGDQATEGALRSRLPNADVVHLAVHGVLDPLHPLFSALLLSGASETGEDDGRLEVREILGLDLRQANLVILSACETALGSQSRGDELVGLARAFLYAGTPTVVASLWPVEDQATEALMTAFHRRVQAGEGIAAALAEAQTEVRSQPRWAAPYYWAGLVVIGDGGHEVAAVSPMMTNPAAAPTRAAQTRLPVTAALVPAPSEPASPPGQAGPSQMAGWLLLAGVGALLAGIVAVAIRQRTRRQ